MKGELLDEIDALPCACHTKPPTVATCLPCALKLAASSFQVYASGDATKIASELLAEFGYRARGEDYNIGQCCGQRLHAHDMSAWESAWRCSYCPHVSPLSASDADLVARMRALDVRSSRLRGPNGERLDQAAS